MSRPRDQSVVEKLIAKYSGPGIPSKPGAISNSSDRIPWSPSSSVRRNSQSLPEPHLVSNKSETFAPGASDLAPEISHLPPRADTPESLAPSTSQTFSNSPNKLTHSVPSYSEPVTPSVAASTKPPDSDMSFKAGQRPTSISNGIIPTTLTNVQSMSTPNIQFGVTPGSPSSNPSNSSNLDSLQHQIAEQQRQITIQQQLQMQPQSDQSKMSLSSVTGDTTMYQPGVVDEPPPPPPDEIVDDGPMSYLDYLSDPVGEQANNEIPPPVDNVPSTSNTVMTATYSYNPDGTVGIVDSTDPDDVPPPPTEDSTPLSYFGSIPDDQNETDVPPPPPSTLEEGHMIPSQNVGSPGMIYLHVGTPTMGQSWVSTTSASSTGEIGRFNTSSSDLIFEPDPMNASPSTPAKFVSGGSSSSLIAPDSPHSVGILSTHSSTTSLPVYIQQGPTSSAINVSITPGSPNFMSSSYGGTGNASMLEDPEGGLHAPDDPSMFVPIRRKDYSAQNTIKDKVVDDLVFFSRHFQIVIKGGTLFKLVERLTFESNTDNDYIDTFLLTYRNFMSPPELLERMLERYQTGSAEIDTAGISASEASTVEKKQKIIRIRVGNVLKRWLSDHYHDFHDPALLARLEQGIEQITEQQLKSSLQRTIQEKQLQKNKVRELIFSNATPASFIPKPNTTWTEWEIIEMARQICLYHQTLYQMIHPKEALNQAWNKHKENAPNIIRMITFFNTLSKWVSTQVCIIQDLKERSKLLLRFMQLAVQLREYNNFDAMLAVLSGLNNTAVHRMKLSWAKAAKKDKETFKKYTALAALTETANNSKNLRTVTQRADPPIIPYLGVCLTDLTFLEDGNSNYLIVQDGRNDIINFEKMRRVAVVIKEICMFQQTPYNFHQVPVIYEFFSGPLPFEDDGSLFKRSRSLEPPELIAGKTKKSRSSIGLSFFKRESSSASLSSSSGAVSSTSSPSGKKK